MCNRYPLLGALREAEILFEAEQNEKKLFVSNIPEGTTCQELTDMIVKHIGPVKLCVLDDRVASGHLSPTKKFITAIVCMEERLDAKKALHSQLFLKSFSAAQSLIFETYGGPLTREYTRPDSPLSGLATTSPTSATSATSTTSSTHSPSPFHSDIESPRASSPKHASAAVRPRPSSFSDLPLAARNGVNTATKFKPLTISTLMEDVTDGEKRDSYNSKTVVDAHRVQDRPYHHDRIVIAGEKLPLARKSRFDIRWAHSKHPRSLTQERHHRRRSPVPTRDSRRSRKEREHSLSPGRSRETKHEHRDARRVVKTSTAVNADSTSHTIVPVVAKKGSDLYVTIMELLRQKMPEASISTVFEMKDSIVLVRQMIESATLEQAYELTMQFKKAQFTA